MKKLLLLSLVLSIGFLGFSQEKVQIKKSIQNISKTMVYVNPTDEVVDMTVAPNPYVASYKDLADEDIIGNTFYDLQSNTSLGNRIHVYEDGTIGAVWTRGIESAAFADRGTGYNYYDGSDWGSAPTERIESVRTGWPSYAPWGANGELIVAHGPDEGLLLATRVTKGTGEWTESRIVGPEDHELLLWPRVITSGTDYNTIHCIALTAPSGNGGSPYQGQDGALIYNRSTDGGANWDIENVIIEGMGSDYYTDIGADDYVWAEPRGGAIAFLVAGAWSDMFMMKSTDNGDNWLKTVIWEHPYPFFDWETTVADTFYCVDNSASITLDVDGNAHVVFGINRVMHLDLGTTYNFYPFIDGVGYWNESMDTFSNNLHALNPNEDHPDSEMEENVNLIGWVQDVNGNGEIDFITWEVEPFQSYRELGMSTMPSIAIDNFGRVLVAFSSTTETYDNTICNYKHIWVRSMDLDGTWGDFEDLDVNINHIFDECIYPVIGQNINGSAYILYQADFEPGLALDDEHGYIENSMIVANYDLNVGINENEFNAASVSQNFPNPFTNTSIVSVNLTQATNLSLEVFNLTGQKVYEVSNGHSNAGTHNLVINAENLSSGVYFYTVNAGNNAITKKMIVN